MTPEQKKIKTYVNAIERRLKVSMKMKARINSDLGTEIHLLMEQGKSVDEVMQEIGTPDEVAERFNEELAEYTVEKRSPLAWLFLILAAVSVVYGVAKVILYYASPTEGLSVIGGADGPTAVFVAGRIGLPWVVDLSCLGLGMACYAAYLLVRYRKCSSVEKSKYVLLWSAAAFMLSLGAFILAVESENAYGGILQWSFALPGFSGRGPGGTIEPVSIFAAIILIISIRRYRKVKRQNKPKGRIDKKTE